MTTLSKEQKAEIIKEFGETDGNTGSTHVQVALLTQRINDLTEHFKSHKKDHHSRRGMLKLVARRNKLLRYLHSNSVEEYRALTDKLNIRQKL